MATVAKAHLLATETPEDRRKRIMAAALAKRGYISIRLQAQLKDPAGSRYVGLCGYSLVFQATSPAMVERAFDAIEKALEGLQ